MCHCVYVFFILSQSFAYHSTRPNDGSRRREVGTGARARAKGRVQLGFGRF